VYAGLDDVFESAGMYAEAIARGRTFADANKRTALVSALTYLAVEGCLIRRTQALEGGFFLCGAASALILVLIAPSRIQPKAD
jgi:prophage maintenance system killer protein